jgi:uncharacterized spore protein YtfJ
MDVSVMVAQTREAMTVRRVYGDPYEKDGLTIILVAKVRGGGENECPAPLYRDFRSS